MADTDGHNLIIENNTIKNNSVSGNSVTGGGITLFLFNNNYVRISCNKILNNSADGTNSAWGGGINTNNANNEVSIVNNYIKGNKHRSDGAGGGGLSIYHGLPKVMKNLFIENSAQTGGGMFIDLTGNSVSQASIKKSRGNILIHQNNYKLTDSGAVNSILANNTIIYNTSTVSGGGISIAGQSPQLMNLILWGNESQLDPQVYGPSEVSYSCIEGGLEGQGNISLNPEFMDSINYYLMESSPCIDSGNPDSSHNDIEDPNNPGSALWPALGSLRNDMGANGGGIFDYVTSADKIYKNIKANNIYTLLQNYPNPFNPATKIKYSIPAEGKGQTLPAGRQGVEVKLVVYDILGREVATLVNEKQKPGNYEIEFNSSSVGFRITSGVYFYKLSTSEYIVTKKMILIK